VTSFEDTGHSGCPSARKMYRRQQVGPTVNHHSCTDILQCLWRSVRQKQLEKRCTGCWCFHQNITPTRLV